MEEIFCEMDDCLGKVKFDDCEYWDTEECHEYCQAICEDCGAKHSISYYNKIEWEGTLIEGE